MGYLIVLRRHATLIAVVAILTGLAAGFGSLLQQNRYTSAAYIELTNASSPFRSSGGSKADLTRAMQTQIDTVRSDSVKTAVADQLGTPAPHVKVSMRAQSDELAIRATSHNRREAARVANAYATAYVAQLAKDNANADRSAQAARQQTESQLQKQLQEVQTSLATATGASAQQLQLRRDLLGAQLRAVAVQDVTQASGDDLSASILSAAAPPTAPSEPRPVRNGLLGLVAGLILGFLAAALLEVVRDKVRDKRDIKMINPDWPVVGTVPLSIRAGNAQTRDRAETYAFRGLRAKLPAVLPNGYPAKILVAGPLGGEGTSTVVAGLARSLAAAGRKVAVIDANTAAPRQHELLGSPRTPTLAQILRGPGGPDRLRHLAVGSFGSLLSVGRSSGNMWAKGGRRVGVKGGRPGGRPQVRLGLPGPGGAAALAGGARDGAGAGHARAVLDDRVHTAARLRVDVDVVAVGVGRGDVHLAGGGPARRQRVLDAVQGGAVSGVGGVVGVVRLLSGGSFTRCALGRRVLALALLVEERRDGDRGQDPDDQDHDQELDEREALLALKALAKGVEHGKVLLQ